jgi:hypothetical protein
MESENTTKSQSVIETENIITDFDSFSKIVKLQSLIKKESALKELCKIFFIIILIFYYN